MPRRRAWTALERGIADGSQMIGFITVEPGLDELRDEPRFQAVVRALNLA